MCGIAAIAGGSDLDRRLAAMLGAQRHRGPDATGVHVDAEARVGLGHNRLSIIDLSPAGRQPMATPDAHRWITLNGEIYNYVELRQELAHHPFRSGTDTEVALAALAQAGAGALDRFIGMFAFALWDARDRRLLAVRDRFGVKPLYYHYAPETGELVLASEIKALWAAGVPRVPDAETWAAYLAHGLVDHGERTFWRDVRSLAPGHLLEWRDGRLAVRSWYDVAARAGEEDRRPAEVVRAEYGALLAETVRLRFRADVPVGINLSGGLDSSVLLAAVHAARGRQDDTRAFTFVTGDPAYDELPWVRQALATTGHPHEVCSLAPEDVPALARSVQHHQDEPFGGLPTLAYARLFEHARACGVIVLLDGQGMDEQWAGYDYYARVLQGEAASLVQGVGSGPATRPECLTADFRAAAPPLAAPRRFADGLRDAQYQDLRRRKLPRALRYNDRVSMRASVELREPFLDHRLVELALRQPAERKIAAGVHKWLLRELAREMLGATLVEAPKRPLQTPQREWLRGPLCSWADATIEQALGAVAGTWLDAREVRRAWRAFQRGEGDNGFFVWQWVNVGLVLGGDAAGDGAGARAARVEPVEAA